MIKKRKRIGEDKITAYHIERCLMVGTAMSMTVV